jgi:hypothetical protein
MLKKVKATTTITREYFVTELYPDLTEEQRATLSIEDVKEDFNDPDFYALEVVVEDPQANTTTVVEEVTE